MNEFFRSYFRVDGVEEFKWFLEALEYQSDVQEREEAEERANVPQNNYSFREHWTFRELENMVLEVV